MSASAPDSATDVVWIPWRPQPSRMPAFEFCTAWWRSHGFEVTLVDSGADPFSLAESRNIAASNARGPVVIADADTIGDIGAIREALRIVEAEQRTILPYTEYRSLGDTGTAEAIAGIPLADCRAFVYPPAVSGLFVTTPQIWASYGGQDPRFRGWLGEDIAHLHAHETLIGPIGRTVGRAYALGHDSAPKEGPQYEANRLLMERYADARGNPEAMRALIAERRYNAVTLFEPDAGAEITALLQTKYSGMVVGLVGFCEYVDADGERRQFMFAAPEQTATTTHGLLDVAKAIANWETQHYIEDCAREGD